MKKICLVVTNDVANDYRIIKESKSLSKEYEVSILGFKSDQNKNNEKTDHYKIIRVSSLLLRKIAFFFMPKIREKVTVSSVSKKKKENNFRLLINDFFMFILYLNKQISVFKGLFRTNADIYQANDLDTLMPVSIYAKIKGKKVIYDSHELCVEEGFVRHKFFKKILFFIEKKYIKKVSSVITVNKFIAKELEERYKLKKKVFVVKNCPYFEKTKYTGKINNPVRILYHGVFAPMRGLEELILSMEYVNNAILYLRGFGPGLETLKALVKDKKLDKKVVFLEKIKPDELVKLGTEFDIGVITYRPTCLNSYYASPNKLFQYLMSGLVLTGSDLPVIKDVIISNKVGKVFDPDNPKSIAKSFSDVIADQDMMKTMKKNSIDVAPKYSWENEEIQLLKAYSQAK